MLWLNLILVSLLLLVAKGGKETAVENSSNHSFHDVSELDCHDGTPVPPEYYANATALITLLMQIEQYFGTKFRIHSGYRTENWNRFVKGVPNSQHLTCSAMDLVSRYNDVSTSELFQYCKNRLITAHEYPNRGFVHIDLRQPPVYWANLPSE